MGQTIAGFDRSGPKLAQNWLELARNRSTSAKIGRCLPMWDRTRAISATFRLQSETHAKRARACASSPASPLSGAHAAVAPPERSVAAACRDLAAGEARRRERPRRAAERASAGGRIAGGSARSRKKRRTGGSGTTACAVCRRRHVAPSARAGVSFRRRGHKVGADSAPSFRRRPTVELGQSLRAPPAHVWPPLRVPTGARCGRPPASFPDERPPHCCATRAAP